MEPPKNTAAMKNFYYVRPAETSEADACGATFVPSRSRQGDFVSAVSTAFNKSLHVELVEACSAVFQQPAEFWSKFSGNDECGGHVDFENTR
jgi:hypothetical protein